MLSDGELILIREALELMIRRCVDEIGKGSDEPFYSCHTTAEKILKRLQFP